MKATDFVDVGRALHRMSQTETGRTAFNYGMEDMMNDLTNIFTTDPHFDKRAFISACGLMDNDLQK